MGLGQVCALNNLSQSETPRQRPEEEEDCPHGRLEDCPGDDVL